METVKIIKNWDVPDLSRQTPGGLGIWENVKFTFDPFADSDYLVVLNYIPPDIGVDIIPGRTYAFMQEPYIPNKFDWVVESHESFDTVFTHFEYSRGRKYIGTQTCLPWHIGKNYDQLINLEIPGKSNELSWITSNKTTFPGHQKRMHFLNQLLQRQNDLEIDLYGFGINPIDDKWQGLASYRYSLAVENSSSKHYWTEKVADCLLSYTLPFYYGCTNLEEYIPEQSFIRIDIQDIELSIHIIQDAISSDQWSKRIDAIEQARQLILNEYQLFPFLARRINSGNL